MVILIARNRPQSQAKSLGRLRRRSSRRRLNVFDHSSYIFICVCRHQKCIGMVDSENAENFVGEWLTNIIHPSEV